MAKPQSDREKAGVPITVLHRSQLDIPPTSAHPVGNRNMRAPTKATTPMTTEVSLGAVLMPITRPSSTTSSSTVSTTRCLALAHNERARPENGRLTHPFDVCKLPDLRVSGPVCIGPATPRSSGRKMRVPQGSGVLVRCECSRLGSASVVSRRAWGIHRVSSVVIVM